MKVCSDKTMAQAKFEFYGDKVNDGKFKTCAFALWQILLHMG